MESLTVCESRIVEEEIESAIESRNEALQTIRELGPPDLVHLVKQAKSGGRQVINWHHFFLDKYLLTFDAVRGIPPCHWGRRFFISQLGSLCKHPRIYAAGQNT